MNIRLLDLISPHSINDFLACYQKNQPLLVHHQDQGLEAIQKLPFLESLEALIRAWPSQVQAHLPDVRDESSAIDVPSKDAHKLFACGMGLLFQDAQVLSPLLTDSLVQLRQDLGLSALTFARCLIYATPDGKGTAPHFDQNINFVYQVSGTKKWRMAPNTQVENPLTRHTMGQAPDSELEGYLEDELPSKMPSNCETYILKPGSLLFVPRGYWHETEAEGDAMALNFTFTAPSWMDLFLAALRSRLAQFPEWRETANGVATPDQREQAEEKLDSLLSMLVDDLPEWRSSDILDVTED
jgi:50S ribosomal protein L16 3-hydroxylase